MRFYKPGQSQYIDQFQQLPLDWMFENIKSLQAEKDMFLANAASQDFTFDYLKAGIRGVDQGHDRLAKEVYSEYTKKLDDITNIVTNDPMASKRAAAELGKLKHEFTNDRRVALMKETKANYEARMKQINENQKYASDVYLPQQDIYRYNPYTESGDINPFVADTYMGEKQDFLKPMMDMMKGFKSDGSEYQTIRDFAGIGLAMSKSGNEYVSEGKVWQSAIDQVSPFLNTTEGQYYIDKVIQGDPMLRNLRNDYFMNPEAIKYMGSGIMHKDSKTGKERELSLYEVVAKKAAEDMFALGEKEIFEKKEAGQSFSGFYPEDMRKSFMPGGGSSYDTSGGTSGAAFTVGTGVQSMPGLEQDKETGAYEVDESFIGNIRRWGASALTAVFGGIPGAIASNLGYAGYLDPVFELIGISTPKTDKKEIEVDANQLTYWASQIATVYPGKTASEK